MCTVRYISQRVLRVEHSTTTTTSTVHVMSIEIHCGIEFVWFVSNHLPRLQLPEANLLSKDVWHPDLLSLVAHFDLTTVCLSTPLPIRSKSAN